MEPTDTTGEVDEPFTLTATVTGPGGAPLAGVQVMFQDNSFFQQACDGPNPVASDAAGKATCSFTESFASTQQLTAFADTNGDFSLGIDEPRAETTRVWKSRPPAALTLAPENESVQINHLSCVTATVTDSFEEGTGERLVRFSVAGVNTVDPETVTTGFAGEADFCYQGTVPGDDTITAYADTDEDGVKDAGEPSGTATKSWLGSDLELVLEPAESEGEVQTDHTLAATVTSAGDPVPDVDVTFERTDSPAGQGLACNQGGVTITTGADGTAACTFSSFYAGDDAIRAFVDDNHDNAFEDGEAFATAHRTWISRPPADVELQPETEGASVAGAERCLSAFVRDEQFSPAGLRLVRFSIAGANAQITPAPVRADTFGGAQLCYTGANAGTDTVTAFADTDEDGVKDAGEPTASVVRRWLSAEPTLTLSPPSATAGIGSTHTLTATATVGGLPAEGVQIYFGRQGFFFFECAALTGADGKATCDVTSSSAATITYEAFADTNLNASPDVQESQATAEVTWQRPDQPATITLAPGSATRLVGTQHCVTAVGQGRREPRHGRVDAPLHRHGPEPGERQRDVQLPGRGELLRHGRERGHRHLRGLRRHGRRPGQGRRRARRHRDTAAPRPAARHAGLDAGRQHEPRRQRARADGDRHRRRRAGRRRQGALRGGRAERGDRQRHHHLGRQVRVHTRRRVRGHRHDHRLRRHRRRQRQGRRRAVGHGDRALDHGSADLARARAAGRVVDGRRRALRHGDGPRRPRSPAGQPTRPLLGRRAEPGHRGRDDDVGGHRQALLDRRQRRHGHRHRVRRHRPGRHPRRR